MQLPVMPPVEPMLATSVPELPAGDGLCYEPKFDGFRCIVFRDQDEIELGSRGGKALTRYFPEVVEALRARLPERCVVDGEIVVPIEDADGLHHLDFDSLSQRIHPAASRVRMLAESTPASFVAFDLLALDQRSLLDTPYADRRALLSGVLDGVEPPVHLTPMTTDPDVGRDWFSTFEGAGLDGVIVKARDIPYQPGKRIMQKVKHHRTADVVVAGFRWHKSGPVVGSLLLGLYADGSLQHVGVASSFSAARRKELLDELAPYRAVELADHPWGEWAGQVAGAGTERMPGAVSRWNAKKDLSWVALRPGLVAEVGYDHLEGDRFRHVTQFKRWRPDREPDSCTFGQLERPASFDALDVMSWPTAE
jgi:ATP-dependent DNA ligase